jgi:UDP-3-O-[3-hydroxymyristoyl] glucosamine N-acyltransferase
MQGGNPSRITAGQLARDTGAELVGDAGRELTGIAPLEAAGPSDLSFLANPAYAAAFKATRAGAVFVPRSVEERPEGVALLLADNPYLSFARAAARFDTRDLPVPGVHPTAVVHPTARLGKEVSIGPLCVVGANAVIGERSVLHALVSVGEDVVIGSDCRLHSQVSVRERCVLGDRVVLQNGVQIGADGYGFAPHEGRFEKVPQIGNVVIGNDVEIGANSCIDRAMMASTVIGEGTKIDDLVMIAHNVQVGPHCLLVAQTGISGSTKLGHHVVLGGQTGVAGHIEIGDMVRVGAKGGVTRGIKTGRTYAGFPAMPHDEWLRNQALISRLDKLKAEVRRLGEELEALKAGQKG